VAETGHRARDPIIGSGCSSLSDEEVLELSRDVVVLYWCGVDPEKYRPDLSLWNSLRTDLPFVQSRRVFRIGEPYLVRPGPRLVEGVRRMREVVARARAPSRTKGARTHRARTARYGSLTSDAWRMSRSPSSRNKKRSCTNRSTAARTTATYPSAVP